MIVKVSSAKYVFFVFVSTILVSSHQLKFTILNTSAITINEYLLNPMDLSILLTGINPMSNMRKLELCFLSNGVICHCFLESLQEARVYLPPTCSEKLNTFWLSIAIINPIDRLCMFSENSILVEKHVIAEKEALHVQEKNKGNLTLVLTLSYSDVGRAALLLNSLSLLTLENKVFQFLVITPHSHKNMIQSLFSHLTTKLAFPVVIISEEDILANEEFSAHYLKQTYAYGLQMALKLLVARIVRTDFYMTLDSDLLLLRPWSSISALLRNGQAVYRHEGRFEAHPDWWVGSEELLYHKSSNPELQGFGVTPAVVSTYGALLVTRTHNRHLVTVGTTSLISTLLT